MNACTDEINDILQHTPALYLYFGASVRRNKKKY